jgi:hypothetical protein
MNWHSMMDRLNLHLITQYIQHNKEKRKEREKSFLFCLYDSAINIHVFMLGNQDKLHVYFFPC